MSNDNLIKQASSNALSLVTLQLFSRLITFLLNAILLRKLSPAVLGLVTVKLELLHTTVVFLGREGLRRALLRYVPGADGWKQRLFHMAFLSIPCGIPALVFVVAAFAGSLPVELDGLRGRFWWAVGGYTISAFIELAIEPLYILCAHLMMTNKRVPVESIALTLRAVVVLGICFASLTDFEVKDHLRIGLMAYPLGQLLYAVSLASGYLFILRDHLPPIRTLIPYPEIEVDETVLQSALDMTKQVLLRYFLSQGDMWIVSLLAPLQDQGVYSVVNNYGSLLCRILLQPIEEAALCFFSQALSKPDQSHVALEYLGLVMKLDLLLSMMTVIYGVPLARPLIGTLLGTRWLDSGMSLALAIYCFLVPVMAFSGILEAFLHAAITRPWNSFYQNTSLIATGLFVIVAVPGTVMLGPVGLIIANMFNFAIRAAASWYFLGIYALERNVKIPSFSYHQTIYWYFGILFGVFLWIKCTFEMDSLFSNSSLSIICTLPITGIVLCIFERPFATYLRTMRTKQKTT